ncbi:hypothetical protein, partial [uncultured Boseongicola sp.]|uniref:hypothetical protein n=1 Tax=uncultured Boseongicola sp. TaxID=1648499 RepID=UPI002602A0D2
VDEEEFVPGLALGAIYQQIACTLGQTILKVAQRHTPFAFTLFSADPHCDDNGCVESVTALTLSGYRFFNLLAIGPANGLWQRRLV